MCYNNNQRLAIKHIDMAKQNPDKNTGITGPVTESGMNIPLTPNTMNNIP